jgi:hypothetical protein
VFRADVTIAARASRIEAIPQVENSRPGQEASMLRGGGL